MATSLRGLTGFGRGFGLVYGLRVLTDLWGVGELRDMEGSLRLDAGQIGGFTELVEIGANSVMPCGGQHLYSGSGYSRIHNTVNGRQ